MESKPKSHTFKKRFPIQIGYQDNVISSMVLVAQGMGFFAANGIDAELIPFTSGKLAFMALKDQHIQAATVADLPVMIFGPETPAKVLSVISVTRRGAWISGRKDKGILTPLDLKGKRIGTQENSAVHFFLQCFLLEHGIDEEKECEIVFMPAIDLPGALANGQIDAFSMRNPFSDEAKQLLGDENVIEFFSDIYAVHYLFSVRNDWFPKEHEARVQLMRALAQAGNFMQSNPDQSMKCILGVLGEKQEKDLMKDFSSFTFSLELGQSLLLTLEQQAEWYAKVTDIPNPKLFDYLTLLNPEPLREVNPALVTLIK